MNEIAMEQTIQEIMNYGIQQGGIFDLSYFELARPINPEYTRPTLAYLLAREWVGIIDFGTLPRKFNNENVYTAFKERLADRLSAEKEERAQYSSEKERINEQTHKWLEFLQDIEGRCLCEWGILWYVGVTEKGVRELQTARKMREKRIKKLWKES